jgi:hypothetical protein
MDMSFTALPLLPLGNRSAKADFLERALQAGLLLSFPYSLVTGIKSDSTTEVH